MVDFSLEDLAAPVALASPNFAVKVAAGALVFGCGLYRDYPGAIVGQNPSAFARGLLDTLCDDRVPLPPPPSIPFVGGQCLCAVYRVTYKFTGKFGDNPPGEEQFTADLYGPISGIRTIDTGVTPEESKTQIFCRGRYPTPACAAQSFWQDVYIEGSIYVVTNPMILSVERLDGTDSCGSLPDSYPPSVIPNDRKTGVITNVYNDGSTYNIPIVYVPITGSVPIKFDVGGIPFKFDFGGLTIGDGDAPPVDLTPVLLRLDKVDDDLGIVKGDIDTVREDIDRVREDTVRIKKGVNKPTPKPGSTDYDEDVKPPGTPPEESGIERLSYVLVELVNIPKNAKNQSGNESPTVFYAGWFEFRVGIHSHTREPIHFEYNIFEAPTGSDGYAYCLYVGYEAEVTVIRNKFDDLEESGTQT